MKKISLLAVSLLVVLTIGACTKKEGEQPAEGQAPQAQTAAVDINARSESKGVGPVTELKVEGFSAELATKGQQAFQAKCSACHKTEERFVGPALKGVTQRRTPEWIMNMILNPTEMTQKDPVAKELLANYLTQMTFQNVTQDEARSILEYFRQIDGAK